MNQKEVYIGIDIGGSWVKAICIEVMPNTKIQEIPVLVESSITHRVASRLGKNTNTDDFIEVLSELLFKVLPQNSKVLGIGISTAGVVDNKGYSIIIVADHLKALKDSKWIEFLKQNYGAPVTLINDADANAIGAAGKGYLYGLNTIGILPIGTGVGFTIWRNGRRWNPNQMLPLLGCVYTSNGTYDQIAGVTSLSIIADHDLSKLFTDPKYKNVKEKYEDDLAGTIYTACVIYHTNIILIGGGLASAVTSCEYPLEKRLSEKVNRDLSHLDKKVEILIMREGNTLALIGAAMLAMGGGIAAKKKLHKVYKSINTELPYDESLMLHQLNAKSIVHKLYEAEEEAGRKLSGSLESISEVAEKIADKLSSGGRLIYVGSGTSGRLAAIDNVELACTFGFPRERVYTLISGGLTDAAIDIESNFEEDDSSIPELLLTSVNENDVVIGISVSGSAYYVLSAMALSKHIGAYTVFIQESIDHNLPFCERVICLNSGREIIAGSTRMKAGTATKKVINFISTTVMILLGKVHGPYMIEMECVNQKLVNRAQSILYNLFKMNEIDSYNLLKRNDFNLKLSVTEMLEQKKIKHGKSK